MTVKHLNEAQYFAQCCLKATGCWKPLSVDYNKSVYLDDTFCLLFLLSFPKIKAAFRSVFCAI
jgi:hypothetical protein